MGAGVTFKPGGPSCPGGPRTPAPGDPCVVAEHTVCPLAGGHWAARGTEPPRAAPQGWGGTPLPWDQGTLTFSPLAPADPLAPCEDTRPRRRAGWWGHNLLTASAAPTTCPPAPHVHPTHIFPRIPRLPKSSWLPLAGENKQKAGLRDDVQGKQLQLDPPLTWAGSWGAQGPHGSLPTSPPGQHSPSRPWGRASLGHPWSPTRGRAALGEGAATGLTCPPRRRHGLAAGG